MWTWLTLEICFTAPVLLRQIRSFWVKLYERNYGDLSEKFDSSSPAFQGHSRSMELTDTGRSACHDFLSLLHHRQRLYRAALLSGRRQFARGNILTLISCKIKTLSRLSHNLSQLTTSARQDVKPNLVKIRPRVLLGKWVNITFCLTF